MPLPARFTGTRENRAGVTTKLFCYVHKVYRQHHKCFNTYKAEVTIEFLNNSLIYHRQSTQSILQNDHNFHSHNTECYLLSKIQYQDLTIPLNHNVGAGTKLFQVKRLILQLVLNRIVFAAIVSRRILCSAPSRFNGPKKGVRLRERTLAWGERGPHGGNCHPRVRKIAEKSYIIISWRSEESRYKLTTPRSATSASCSSAAPGGGGFLWFRKKRKIGSRDCSQSPLPRL